MKHTLDKYEQQVEESLSNGDFVSTSDFEDTKQMFQEAAKNYLQLQELIYFF